MNNWQMPYEVDALTRIIYRHRVVLLQNRSSILSWQAYWWIAHSPWPNFNNPLRVMSWTPVHFLSPDWTDHWWIEFSASQTCCTSCVQPFSQRKKHFLWPAAPFVNTVLKHLCICFGPYTPFTLLLIILHTYSVEICGLQTSLSCP